MLLLELDALTVRFGGLTALSGLDLAVEPGALVALIGPNGAGKTTAFNVISGVYAPSSGQVRLLGRPISGLAPHAIARLGVGRTFQNIRLFHGLSALDNVRAALVGVARSGLRDVLRGRAWQAGERALEARARDLLERLGLSASALVPAGGLPYGEQRRLEIARALATGPELLLLDEPAAGMNPAEKQELRALIRRLRQEFGLTIVLIEHDVQFVMDLCDRIAVLDHGEKIAEGAPEAVRRDPRVIEAYLGREASEEVARDGQGPIPRSEPQASEEVGRDGQGPIPRSEPQASEEVGSVTALLRAEALEVRYGAIRALRGIDLEVHSGEIVALIGSNGAGKSTLLRAISGLVRPAAGRIWLEGVDVTAHRPEAIVGLGCSHVPEGRRIFANLSVLENLQMGAYPRRGVEREGLERVFELFPRLAERLQQAGGTLSGGEQQMLAIGRALMAEPILLLLDEPSLGLAPLLVQQIFAIVRQIGAQGTTVVLVEQNARQALRVAHRAYVLETGALVLHGPAAELARDPRVRQAYLGETA